MHLDGDKSERSFDVTHEADLDLNEWDWVNKDEDDDICERLTKLTRSLSICVGRGKPANLSKYYQKDDNKSKSTISNHNNNNQLDVKELDFETNILQNKECEPNIPLFDCIFTAGLCHDNILNCQIPFTKNVYPEDVSRYRAQKQQP